MKGLWADEMVGNQHFKILQLPGVISIRNSF